MFTVKIKKQMILPDEKFWKIFKETDGALSCTEAIAIMNIAAEAPKANRCVEFGVYKGKSALSASLGLEHALFYLVEPEFENEEFKNEVENTLKQIPYSSVEFSFSSMYSTDWLKDNERMFGYVFVDSGSHQDGLPMQEVKLLEDRMVKDGIIAFHDWNSQFVEVKQASDYLVSTGKFEYIPINWEEIINYVRENDLERNNRSWHHNELPFPNFVGAVRRK